MRIWALSSFSSSLPLNFCYAVFYCTDLQHSHYLQCELSSIIPIMVLNQYWNGVVFQHLTFLTWLYSWINCVATILNWLDFMIIKFFQEAACVFLESLRMSKCLPFVARWGTGWVFLSYKFLPSECCRHCSNVFWH